MADQPPSHQDPAQAYAVIEQAYCEDRWKDVLAKGEPLLRELKDQRDPTSLELLQRLRLLLAHTYLYGLGKREAAEALYSAVSSSDTEPALRETARQGLEQCGQSVSAEQQAQSNQQERPPERGVEPDPALPWVATRDQASPVVKDAAGTSPDAPWVRQTPSSRTPTSLDPTPTPLEASASPSPALSLIPDVVEEPELIQVHQSDPSLAEEIELEIQSLREHAAIAAQKLSEIAIAAKKLDATDEGDEELKEGLLVVVIS